MSIEDQLAEISPERRDAVAAWLVESVGQCTTCEGPVRRIDPRRAESAGFAHLSCPTAAPPALAADDEPVSAAVAARARRSDWG